jgi:ATP-dependent helicase/nuclease subunit B
LKALIFAAGLGSRLKEYTKDKPKALVEVNGKPMLQILIEKFISYDITEIYINIHHFGEQIIQFLEKHQHFGCQIKISDERDLLLNTGGGLKKVLNEMDKNEDLLIHNVDILTDFNLHQLITEHQKSKNIATLLVQKRDTSRYLLFNEQMELKAWTNIKTAEVRPEKMHSIAKDLEQFAFSGIHIINQRALNYFPIDSVFEIIPEYLKISESEKVKALDMKNTFWLDLGKPEALKKGAEWLNSAKSSWKFLDIIIDHFKNNPELMSLGTCIVTPNRRAGRFLKKGLMDQFPGGGFLPEIISIDDFIFKNLPWIKLDEVDLTFKLYHSFISIAEVEIAFDDFLNYASTLIQDFNELDMNMANAKSIFNYLSEAKAIQQWNPDGSPLSESQKEYLRFYNQLSGVYQIFKEDLLSENYCYQGMAYRFFAENIETLIEEMNWDHLVMAGFNALTNSESQIFKKLDSRKNTHLIWDVDRYYLDDDIMEAGMYMRRHGQWTQTIKEQASNFYKYGEKELNIIGSPGVLGQARLAVQFLKENIDANPSSIDSTAVVTADENLLLGILHSMPPELLQITNISMGFPIMHISAYRLIENIIRMHLQAEKLGGQNRGDFKITRTLFQEFLQNKLIQVLTDKNDKNHTEFTFQFLSLEKIIATLFDKGLDQFDFLFRNTADHASHLNQMISQFIELVFAELTTQKFDKESPQEYDALLQIKRVIERLQELMNIYHEPTHLKTYFNLFKQLLRSSKQSFIGDNENGLQLMGLLETRLMDFKTIILLSTNEDILPTAAHRASFIPNDIRYEFQLPGIQERTAVFAYHFYRLLQRAEKIYLLYSTSKKALSGGEKSRFIKQLEFELPKYNPKVKIRHELLSFNNPQLNISRDFSIEKDHQVMERLDEIAKKGLSPSAIINYVRCPLRFYLEKIAKIREAENNDGLIDDRLKGTIIHRVLEDFYKPYTGSIVPLKDFLEFKKQIPDLLPSYFVKEDFKGKIDEGANYLIFKDICHYLQEFIQYEYLQSKKANQPPKIVDLEKNLSRNISIPQQIEKILISGVADRIDNVDGIDRVLDYKTGSIDDKKLKVPSFSDDDSLNDIFRKSEYNKALQLFIYKWMYEQDKSIEIIAGIISFRKIKSPYLMMKMTADEFEQLIPEFEALISEIFNAEIPFKQTNDENNCRRCPFVELCSKNIT